MLNHKGQALIEYVLIVAIISVITISLVSYFGGYLKDSITKTSCSLIDKEFESGEGFERIRRITGYLVGTMDHWNNAKTAEEADRVKHGLREEL